MRIDARKVHTTLPRIQEAALALFVERGVEATTTKAIARRARVAEGSIYRHFASKDDLAHALYRENLEELSALLFAALRPGRSFAENMKSLLDVLFARYELEPLLARFLLFGQFREAPRFPADFRFPSEAFAEALRMEGKIPVRERPLLTALLFGAAVRTVFWRVEGSLGDLRPLAGDVAARLARMAA